MINSDYLDNLNNAQKEAVLHVDGPLLIVAGAGSGKTKVLTSRIAHIIKKKKLHGFEFMKMKICGFLLNTINMTVQKKKVRTKKKKRQIPKKIKLNVGVVYTMNLIKWLMNVVDTVSKVGDVT